MDIGGVLLLIAGLVVLLVIFVVVLAVPFVLLAAIAEPMRRPRTVPAPPPPVRFADFTDDDEIEARHHSR